MRNIALWIAYDGTHFVGSQLQASGRSVQGVLEQAWAQLTQEQRRFVLSGRTDAGVHAQGQVANVHTETRYALHTIQRALNALLPSDVSALNVQEAPPSFHARYSAIRRTYRYLIDNAPVRLPFLRHYALHITGSLDQAAMREALAYLPGEHDFAAFASVSSSQVNTVRQCYSAQCSTIEMLGRPLIAVDIAANAFLYHMVRTIIGTVILVGQGRMQPEEFGRVLAERNRRHAGPTASACGLTLMAVEYPPEALNIAAR